MLEIQVCGRHNLEPHLFPSFHALIFGHEDLAQLFIPKNTVFHGFFIFRLDFNPPAGPKLSFLVPLYFIYTGSVHYLTNLIVWNPKFS
jgi:hypothetical protein